MPHFFVPPENVSGGRFFLGPEESRHLAVVLRKKAGEEVGLFDGKDRSFRARLATVLPDRVEGVILGEEASPLLPYRLTIYQGLPKGDKMEWILEKATELGAAAFVPLTTARSVPRIPPDRLPSRLARWRKTVLAAAKQCGQNRVPDVSEPVPFPQAVSGLSPDALTLIPWEGEERRLLRDALRERRSDEVNVFIGPEGGFSPEEVALARAKGAVPVSLGPLILRTETAGLAVAAALLHELVKSPA